MNIVILIAIWIVIGLIIATLAPMIWKRERPYGETGDYVVAVIAAVLTGLLDWFVVPMFGIEGTLLILAAILEPALVALLAMWVMRLIKR
jgi:uncharacterized membrane protein YeaQ/YmgE (transglycosylase-associated protein family)